MTTTKAYLGFVLFHEEQMSTDNTVACRSCHHFNTGGADARTATNPGYDGQYGTADDVLGSPGVASRNTNGSYAMTAHAFDPQATKRKAPSVVNAAYSDRLFYDGRARNGNFTDPVTGQVTATGATALENLILQPPTNPVEMAHPGRSWAQIVAKIAAAQPLRLADQIPARIQNFIGTASYPDLFQRAFGTRDVTATRIVFAIASYLRTLVSDQSRFDYALNNLITLTPQEQQGRTLFEAIPPGGSAFGGPAACQRCHSDVSLQSHTVGPVVVALTGYYQTPTGNFHNTGIRPVAEDQGEGGVSGLQTEMGRFKTPFLRNIALHPTYGHTGQMLTLASVVDFYSRGGDFHTGQAPEIVARNFTATEKAAMVAFLNTLTDPRVVNGVEPFDTVRLGSERGAMRPTPLGTASSGGGANTPVAVTQEPVFLGSPNVTFGLHQVAANSWVGLVFDTASNPAGADLLGARIYLAGQDLTLATLGISSTAPNGSGYTSTTLAVPNLPHLAGMTITGQWFAFDASASQGLSTSAAFDVHL